MFAYCASNPINLQDPVGTAHVGMDPLRGGAANGIYCGAAGGAAGGVADGVYCGAAGGLLSLLSPFIWAANLLGTLIGTAPTLEKTVDTCAKEKVETITIADTSQKQYSYWVATLENGVVTPSIPLSYSEAQAWVSSGNNLLCRDHLAAIAIVKFWPSARWDSRHGCAESGYLNHYHLSSAHGNHIWYYGE